MTRPSDAHWALLDARAFHTVRSTLEAVRLRGVDHVLAGGWAVYAHAPVVPSVDCDLYVAAVPSEALLGDLRALGLRTGPQGDVEFLLLDEPVEFLGFGDPDLGVPGFTFTPRALCRDRLSVKDLALEPPVRGVRVPDAAALAVAKVAALRGRSLGYLAHGQGRARMLLGPQLVPMMLSLSASYYLRKAGKDLFDIGLLLDRDAPRDDFRAIVRSAGLEAPVRDTLREIPGPVAMLADDMADRVGRPAPSGWVRSLLD